MKKFLSLFLTLPEVEMSEGNGNAMRVSESFPGTSPHMGTEYVPSFTQMEVTTTYNQVEGDENSPPNALPQHQSTYNPDIGYMDPADALHNAESADNVSLQKSVGFFSFYKDYLSRGVKLHLSELERQAMQSYSELSESAKQSYRNRMTLSPVEPQYGFEAFNGENAVANDAPMPVYSKSNSHQYHYVDPSEQTYVQPEMNDWAGFSGEQNKRSEAKPKRRHTTQMRNTEQGLPRYTSQFENFLDEYCQLHHGPKQILLPLAKEAFCFMEPQDRQLYGSEADGST